MANNKEESGRVCVYMYSMYVCVFGVYDGNEKKN